MDKTFFDTIIAHFGALNQSQVDGVNVVGAAIAAANLPLTHQAYLFATAWHETAHTMQPIEEYGKGQGRPYGLPSGPYGQTYYGRGYVQLTWDANYKHATERLHALGILAAGDDLERDASLALRPDIAAAVLVHGCEEGWFGKALPRCVNYADMRHAVNGSDRADMIAGYAEVFEQAIRASQAAPTEANPAPASVSSPPAPAAPVASSVGLPPPKPGTAPLAPPPKPKPPAPLQPQTMGPIAALIYILTLLFQRKAF